jgi:hypothetical protein
LRKKKKRKKKNQSSDSDISKFYNVLVKDKFDEDNFTLVRSWKGKKNKGIMLSRHGIMTHDKQLGVINRNFILINTPVLSAYFVYFLTLLKFPPLGSY